MIDGLASNRVGGWKGNVWDTAIFTIPACIIFYKGELSKGILKLDLRNICHLSFQVR